MVDNELNKLKQNAVEMANGHHATMQGMSPKRAMRYVKSILADNEIVLAIWQDPSEPDGVGMLLVKGRNKLREAIMSNVAINVKTSAVPCVCYEQAIALRETLGHKLDA
jgi:hypothetical protein